jgi:hypothetical protein
MAISFITSPNDWQNVYNEIVFNVSSTNSTQANFQFLVDVNVSGQTNPVARLTYPKQPNIGTINIDVSNVVKDYVTYDLGSFNNEALINNTNSVAKYWLEFGEVYDNVSGIPTIYPNLTQYGTSGSPKSGSNAIFDFLEWSKTAFSSGKLLSTLNQVSLNQTTFTPSLRANQQMWLSFFDKNQTIKELDIDFYDSNGNLLGGDTTGFFTNYASIVSLNVGYALINSLSLNSLFEDPQSAYYILRFKDVSAQILFEKRINIDNKCTPYEVYRLHWLNKFGGFDSFNFTRVSKENIEIEQKQFKKLQSLNYSTTDRLKTDYFTKFSESIELNTDLLSNEEWQGLRELVISPVVILETSPTTYIPINILETTYSPNKVVNEQKPTSLRITIQYTFDNYRQTQ